MSGLRRLCQQYGSIKIQGVRWVWDFVSDEPVKESEMTKERKMASEKARWNRVREKLGYPSPEPRP